jgi:hypothetical protein
VDEEDEHPKMADVAEATDLHGLDEVVDKDQAHGNRAKEVEICEIARIIYSQMARIPRGSPDGGTRSGGAGSCRAHVCPHWIGFKMFEDGLHEGLQKEERQSEKVRISVRASADHGGWDRLLPADGF